MKNEKLIVKEQTKEMERNGEKDVTILERGLKYKVLDWMHTAKPYRHFNSFEQSEINSPITPL